MKNKKILDRFLGCTFGGAVADAFTFPYNGIFTKDLISSISVDTKKYKKTKTGECGNFSLPTMSVIAVIKAIISKNKPDDMGTLAELKTMYLNEEHRGKLYATIDAIKNAIDDKKWEEIPVKVGIADCSTALRSAPIGLWNYDNKPKVIHECSAEISKVTHKDYRATSAAIMAGSAISYLINIKKKFSFDDFLKNIYNTVMLEDKETALLLKELPKIYKKKNPEIALLKLLKLGNISYSPYEYGGGISPFSLSVVFTALYVFTKNFNNFDKMMTDIVHISGEINALACIAGNFWGALNGYNALPVELVDNLLDKEELYALTVKLFKLKHGIKE